MADTSEGSGAENESADDAPKTDYVITGDTDPSEIEAEKLKNEDDDDIDDDEDALDDDETEEGSEDDDPEDGEDDDDDDEEQSDDEDERDDGKRKRRGGFQKKIDKLNAEIDNLKEQLQVQQSTGRKVDPFAPEPKRQDFRTDREFDDAHLDWRLDQREAKRQTDARKENFKQSQTLKVQRYEEKTGELRKDKDYAKTVDAYDGPLTIGMQQELIESEYGPEIALEIAKDPSLGDRMAKMNLMELKKQFARLEVKIERNAGKKRVKTTSKPKVKSSAPPPVKPVKGSSKVKVDPDSEPYEDYLKRRQKRRGF